jgi:hypothetical protein
MMKIKYGFVFTLLFLTAVNGYAQLIIKKPVKIQPTSFAIVVDKATYEKCGTAVDAYKDAVEDDGLSAYILVNEWKNPDEIKAEINKLLKQNPPLEGIALVGDIPIPMIRNAQHLTSAFKIDEKKSPLFKSSAPSDRFYDALDLKFEFIKQDTVNKLCFYYSLLPESPQIVKKTIYSGRIKPPVDDNSKYQAITDYLNRVVEQKKENRIVDNMLVFSGHGYNSEALTAWADENLALREQFPDLYTPGKKLKKLNHTMDDSMKDILLTEIQDPKLDIAIFHAHGDDDRQYINNYPEYKNPEGNIEEVKLYLRSKLRAAQRRKKPIDKEIAYYKNWLGVPESWFEGMLSDSLAKADSLLDYSLDIHIEDVQNIKPQPALIVFDECFNGSFHHSPYIAGEYVFGKGKTIAGLANTTNALQDQWIDELSGLLSYGVRLGEWHKFTTLIESHILGDPTYHFTGNGKTNLGSLIELKKNDVEFWKGMLKNNDPVIRSLSVEMLFKNLGKEFESGLVELYKGDASYNVRMHAIKCLASLQTPAFHEILKESISDPYELIRRISAVWMGLVGKKEYIPFLAKQLLTDESERVSFNVKSSLTFIDPEESYNECIKYLNSLPVTPSTEKAKNNVKAQILRSKESLKELLDNVNSDTLALKNKIQEMRTFRNYTYLQAIPDIIKIAVNENEKTELRTVAIEALGWFNFAYNKNLINEACEKIISTGKAPKEVLNEAKRTINRIKDGSNNPITP